MAQTVYESKNPEESTKNLNNICPRHCGVDRIIDFYKQALNVGSFEPLQDMSFGTVDILET